MSATRSDRFFCGLEIQGSSATLPRMSTLVLNLDDRVASTLATLAARSQMPLPEWATEQLSRLATAEAAPHAEAYSAEWRTAFGSITDPTFPAPPSSLPRPVRPLDAE